MLCGSETWAFNRENEIKLERNEMKMVRWMVGTKLIERVPSKELRQRLGLEDMQSVMTMMMMMIICIGPVSENARLTYGIPKISCDKEDSFT